MPRGKRRQIQDLMDEIGDTAEVLKVIFQIATGQTVWIPNPEVPGTQRSLTPTLSEMQDAARYSVDQKFGRPSQKVDVAHQIERPKWNPDLLSIKELEELERITRKAEIVEGELVALPEGEKK